MELSDWTSNDVSGSAGFLKADIWDMVNCCVPVTAPPGVSVVVVPSDQWNVSCSVMVSAQLPFGTHEKSVTSRLLYLPSGLTLTAVPNVLMVAEGVTVRLAFLNSRGTALPSVGSSSRPRTRILFTLANARLPAAQVPPRKIRLSTSKSALVPMFMLLCALARPPLTSHTTAV